jgi:PAS domain S-box-containing protein
MIDNVNSYSKLVRAVILASVGLVTTLVLGVAISNLINNEAMFRFNPFALFSIAAIVSNLTLLFIINRTKHKAPETFWFSLFLIEIIYWAICEMMQRFSVSPETAISWYSLTPPGWITLGVTFFIYTLQITGRLSQLRNILGAIAVVIAPIVFILVAFKTKLLVDYSAATAVWHPWGYYSIYGPLFNYFLVWLELFFVASLIIMYQQYRTTKNPTLKRQSIYNSVALLIPLAVGSMTDGLLPALHMNVIPLAIPLTSIMAAIVGYASIKYRIFSFNPNTVAANILAGMNEIVLILSPALEIQYVNERVNSLLGYNDGALLGPRLNVLFRNGQHFERFQEIVRSARNNEHFITGDGHIITAKGDTIPVLISAAQIVPADGGEKSYVVVLTDVSRLARIEKENKDLEDTKRAMLNALEDAQVLEDELKEEKSSVEKKVVERTKQLAEEQAKLNASIDSLQIGFLITDIKDEILSMNAAAYGILGIKPSHDFSLKSVSRALADGVDLHKLIKRCHVEKKPVNTPDITLGKKFLKLFITPILTDKKELIGTVILLQDVTEERILARSKDEFFSIASHELRTPLTAIRGNTSMIQSYFEEVLQTNPDMKEMIVDIHNSSVRLIEIVNDFLDASRLEQGGMEFNNEDVDVAEIADIVVKEMQSVAEEKKLYINNNVGKQPKVWADADRVKQVIYNLLGNAMKFTDEGGITIHANVDGGFLKVFVSDTGRGISEDKQALLFRKFQQAGKSLLTRDTTRGTGLGLYISKLLVENMGGKISLESSELGKGTTFFFSVPLSSHKHART